MADDLTAEPTPDNPSEAHVRMAPAWQVVDDILAGPAQVRARGKAYLPIYASESDPEYQRRLKTAPWQPEFADILLTLSSKPFGKEVALKDGATEQIKTLAEDIDGKGNNLTAFSRPLFRKGIAAGMSAIMVDFPTQRVGITLADERTANARPYWVAIRAENVLALYTTVIKGKEVPVHVRLRECSVERDGFAEHEVERVRVLDRAKLPTPTGAPDDYGPPTWTLYEKKTDQHGKVTWPEVGAGVYAPLTEIPLALFWTGERDGPQFARPPLDALADKQMELYRALARKDEILTYAGSPMLCATGIAPPAVGDPPLEVGPKRVLFAPPGMENAKTGWDYIQPDAANLTEIREDVKALVDDIRRLGMQPLTQKSGGVTATASSIEGAKAHSAVQAWALGLADALEQAFVFTCQWLRQDATVEVEVDTDFSVEPYAQAPLDALTAARKARDISRPAYLASLRRFDVLPPDFDAVEDQKLLDAEAKATAALAPAQPAIDPATGLPIKPAAQPPAAQAA